MSAAKTGSAGSAMQSLPAVTLVLGGARSGNVVLYDRIERGRERSQPVERFGVISGMIETARAKKLYDRLEKVVGTFCPGLAKAPLHIHRFGASHHHH